VALFCRATSPGQDHCQIACRFQNVLALWGTSHEGLLDDPEYPIGVFPRACGGVEGRATTSLHTAHVHDDVSAAMYLLRPSLLEDTSSSLIERYQFSDIGDQYVTTVAIFECLRIYVMKIQCCLPCHLGAHICKLLHAVE